MDEALLREACRNFDEARMERLIQSLSIQPTHLFSKQYEKQKQKIIRQHESYSISQNQFKGRKLSKTTVRILLVAALLMALLIGSALAFEPVRHFIFSYFDGTDIIFNNDNVRDSLDETFSYIPQGYTLEEEEREKLSNFFVYRDENQNELVISSLKNGSTVFINSEDVGHEEVDIQGFIGYYIEREDGLILTWATGKYHHIVSADITETSHITKEDILRIAASRIIK